MRPEPRIRADFLPDPYPEFGHDPHCMVMAPSDPERLYQQNHCGIYRLNRPAETWTHVGEHLPAEIGDIGSHRGPSPRPRHGLGIPDGRHQRLAAHEPRGQTGGVSEPRRRAQMDPP